VAGAEGCGACGHRVRWCGALVDLLPEVDMGPGIGQRFMESPLIVRIYERHFRPALTRVGSRMRYSEEAAYLARFVKPVPGLPALDLACGTGRYSRQLADLVGAERVIGLDLSLAMLARATIQPGAQQILFCRGSAQALPFAAASLGAINCFGAMHLFPDPAGALAEIARTVAPGGSFTCLTSAEVAAGMKQRIQRAFSRLFAFRFFASGELERILEENGFDVVDSTLHGMLVLLAATRRGTSPG
jgi:ubiquinone/menaquinone biosynthesis C-methylase UbiE